MIGLGGLGRPSIERPAGRGDAGRSTARVAPNGRLAPMSVDGRNRRSTAGAARWLAYAAAPRLHGARVAALPAAVAPAILASIPSVLIGQSAPPLDLPGLDGAPAA